MFIWQCCTPGLRKSGSPQQLSGVAIRKRSEDLHRKRISHQTELPPPRSLSTADLPESDVSSSLSSGRHSRIESLFKPEFSILTYNIFMRPDVPMVTTPEYQEIRLQLFTEYVLPHYDVVCLQEMFNMPLSSRRKLFIDQARAYGFHWTHHSKRTHSLSPKIDGGLLVLSKLPIVKSDILNFSSAAFADWYATKGVLYCLVQVGPKAGHFIHLFCTHLQATYDEMGKKISESVRIEQIKQTAEFINQCVEQNGDWPIAICGDINVQCRKDDGSDSDEYQTIMETLRNGLAMRGEHIRDLTKEIDANTHPVTYGESRIDDSGNVFPKEISLTDVKSLKSSLEFCNQALDKIFWIPPIDSSPLIEPVSTAINEMLIEKNAWKVDSHHPLTHLSDHYAVETKVKVKSLDADMSAPN